MSAVDAGVRASDAERERAAQLLQGAAADGRLSPEEAGERLAAVSDARFREELARLLSDLPGGARGLLPGDPAAQRPRYAAWWMAAGVIRLAAMAALFWAMWFFWGLRFWMLWPLAFLALGRLFWWRRWRRRGWRYGALARSSSSARFT